MKRDARYYLSAILGIPIFIPLLPVLLVALPVVGLYQYTKGAILKRRFRRTWGKAGKLAVLVYSDSPNWKDYIETQILPRVASRVVTLNWSRRAEWRTNPPLEAQVFRHWAGSRAFNPIAIVVPARGRVRTIRFWQAFRDYKQGKTDNLQKQQQLLFESIGAA